MESCFDYWDLQTEESKKTLRAVEEKYGANRWWESDDTLYVLRHQIDEPHLILPLDVYMRVASELLQRPLSHLECAFNREGIRDEIRLAIARKDKGIGQSDEQREAAHEHHVRSIEYIVKNELPKDRVMKIDLSQKSDRDENGTDQSGYDGWMN